MIHLLKLEPLVVYEILERGIYDNSRFQTESFSQLESAPEVSREGVFGLLDRRGLNRGCGRVCRLAGGDTGAADQQGGSRCRRLTRIQSQRWLTKKSSAMAPSASFSRYAPLAVAGRRVDEGVFSLRTSRSRGGGEGLRFPSRILTDRSRLAIRALLTADGVSETLHAAGHALFSEELEALMCGGPSMDQDPLGIPPEANPQQSQHRAK